MISSYVTFSFVSLSYTILIFILFFYFYVSQKERFFGFWALSWLFCIFGQLLIQYLKMSSLVALALNEGFIVICTLLFGLGTYSFINQNIPRSLIIYSTINILWILFCVYLAIPFSYRISPTLLFILIIYLKMGISFINDKNVKYLSYRLIGISFIMAGVLLIALISSANIRNIDSRFTPWLFLINSIVTLIMCISVIDVNFKNQIEKLKKTQKQNIDLIKEIKNQEEHYEKIIELMPDALFIHKGEVPIKANSAAHKLMNSNACRDSIDDMLFNIHPDYRKQANRRLKKLTTSETTVPFITEKIILRNGEIIEVETGGTSYRHNGEMYIVTVARDISERRKAVELESMLTEKNQQLEKAYEYNRLKTDFFTMIAHELKTPLNIILGSIQMLLNLHGKEKECLLNSNYLKYTRMMKQNCYRLLKLTNNLIDLTKIDSGSINLYFSECNIVQVVEAITESVVDFANNLGIALIFDTNIEEKIIVCDLDKIERIILNLLSNALKFSNNGGKVEVNVADKEEYIEIAIKDNGIGIPKDKKQVIFNKFVQVDSLLSRNREGSGIGLSLVKALVDLHGGDINVRSELNKGSEFVFTIPSNIEKKSNNIKYISNKQVNIEKLLIEFADIYSL